MIRIIKTESSEDMETARVLLLEYGGLRDFDEALGDYDRELAELPGEYAEPQGRFLIAFYNGQPAGCVALRKREDDICEMKRLFVRPDLKGKMIGRALVEHIIEEARGIGYRSMRLDTHPWMLEAEGLYRSVGFKEIEAYRHNPIEGVKFFELDLQNPPGKDWTIRCDFEPGDIDRLVDIHGSMYLEEYGYDRSFRAYVAEGLGEYVRDHDPDKDRLWLAELCGEIAGAVTIVARSDKEAQLRWYFVLPEHRGKGLGRELMNRALAFCRVRRYKKVYLWTTSELTAAAHVYTSSGFNKTEEISHEIWGKHITEEKYELIL